MEIRKKSQKKELFKKLVISTIEKQKENRTKHIFAFTLSLTEEQEKSFRRNLKELIMSVGDEATEHMRENS
jgi:hypothetical protein